MAELASWNDTPTRQAIVEFARTAARPALRLLVLHDDAEREFDYVAGAEDALARSKDRSWSTVSMKQDWAAVFPEA